MIHKKMMMLLGALIYSGVVWAEATDCVVMRYDQESGLHVDYHEVVNIPAKSFLSAKKPAGPHAELTGHGGQKLWLDLGHAGVTRSETHGLDHIQGHHFHNDEWVFVVRAPQGWVEQFSLSADLDAEKQSRDWSQLLSQAGKKGPQQAKTSRGAVDNRINLLFLGDGFTAAQEATYNQRVDEVINYMLTFEPYVNYAGFHSFDRLFITSNQSGADRPAACYSPASFVDTALDATFCTANIQRLLTVNASKVYTEAAASPNWDEIVVIVNDQEYGGAGGAFSTISTNALAADVFIHEYGHTFTGLADEYDTAFPGFPACSDVNGPACEANVTDVSNRNDLKWNYLVAPSTPVPTPVPSAFDQLVGLFEGARYLSSGMYRPKNVCNMRFLGVDFCEVCAEEYVFRIYQVAYADAGLLDLIEPESMSPASTNVGGMVSVTQNFSVDVLQPSHDLSVSWWVNGVQQSSSDNANINQSFDFTPAQAGMATVMVRVRDPAPLVHSSRQNELPEFEHQWSVDVENFVDLIFADGFE